MKCQYDQHKVKYACTTHNAFLCKKHFKQHMSDRKAHMTLEIDNALVHSDFEKLKYQIIQRIKALEQSKHQIASKASQLIAEIEQACMSSIQNLDDIIISCRANIIDNNFNDVAFQNVTMILNTTLKIEIDQQLRLNIREEPIREQLIEIIREATKDDEKIKQQPIREPFRNEQIKGQPIKDIETKQLVQIPSNKELENSASLEDKIEFCTQLSAFRFFPIEKKWCIKEILFSDDQSFAFICKFYAGTIKQQTVRLTKVSIQQQTVNSTQVSIQQQTVNHTQVLIQQ
jgi:hypothetical protein